MKKLFYIFVGAVLTLPASVASAQHISDYFMRVSEPETFTIDPATIGHTVGRVYSGPVEVIVSGTWENNPNEIFDACYVIYKNGWGVILSSDASMTLGLQGCAGGGSCCMPYGDPVGGRHFCRWLSFVEGVGFRTGRCDLNNIDTFYSYLPPYNANHEYHFVLDLGEASWTFGVGDCGFWDNLGGLTVTLYQLEPGGPTPIRPYTWGHLKTLYH